MIRYASFMFALIASSAFADQLTGRVVSIAHGDTVTVLDASNQQHKIRLAGIDAPEKKQPYGQRAKQHLASQVFNRQVIRSTLSLVQHAFSGFGQQPLLLGLVAHAFNPMRKFRTSRRIST